MSRTKPNFAENTPNHANDTVWSFTLRELHRMIRRPGFWIVIGVAVLLTALAGPYFTLERLAFPQRVVFWGVTLVFSTTLMTFLSILTHVLLGDGLWRSVLASALSTLIGLLPVIGSVYVAEGLATGFASGWSDMAPVGTLALYVAPSLLAATSAVNLLLDSAPDTDAQPSAAKADPVPQDAVLLLGKLPAHLGRDIVSVQAQDHYVEVTTPNGSAMVLMRLGDAVKDLAPLGGMQVHRSWWINLRHVTRQQKGASGPELVMSTGQTIPVGRSFRAQVRDALTNTPG